MDVTNEEQVNAGVDAVVEKYGKVDILVCNAGIQIVKPLVDFPYDEWKRLLAIHLDGAFLTTRACLKHMYQANYGRVIFMGSVHSKEASVLKRSEEHTSELQSRGHLVCRLLLEKKKNNPYIHSTGHSVRPQC